MKTSTLLIIAFMMLSTALAQAQDLPKAEIFGGYSYGRVSVLSQSHTSMNGWNASVTANLNRWFGVAADFGGLYGSAGFTVTVMPLPPVGFKAQGNVHTFLFGPQFSYRTAKLTPFTHFLVGGAHLGGTEDFIGYNFPGSPSHFSLSSTSFSVALGGGADYQFTRKWAWRGQADYLRTSFANQNQNNLRISTGLVFRW
jgi:opacity protein-like surface antigen